MQILKNLVVKSDVSTNSQVAVPLITKLLLQKVGILVLTSGVKKEMDKNTAFALGFEEWLGAKQVNENGGKTLVSENNVDLCIWELLRSPNWTVAGTGAK